MWRAGFGRGMLLVWPVYLPQQASGSEPALRACELFTACSGQRHMHTTGLPHQD